MCGRLSGGVEAVLRAIVLLALLGLAACKPPAADNYMQRVDLKDTGSFASEALPSPDTAGAGWAESQTKGRIIYGQPGKTPLLALECTGRRGAAMLQLTRYAPADREAQALAAMVGNRMVARIPVDAVPSGRAWIWQGSTSADEPNLDALLDPVSVELTIPGAGTTVLNPSPMPGNLLAKCRALNAPPAPPADRR
jgi:hypothetical protein